MRSKWIILNRVDRDLWDVSHKYYILPEDVLIGEDYYYYENCVGKYLSIERCHDMSIGEVKSQEDGTLKFQFWRSISASIFLYNILIMKKIFVLSVIMLLSSALMKSRLEYIDTIKESNKNDRI